jgi:hypothetical protein
MRVISWDATGMLFAAAFVRTRGTKMTGFFPGFALTLGTKLAVPANVIVVVPSAAATFIDVSLGGTRATRGVAGMANANVNAAIGEKTFILSAPQGRFAAYKACHCASES